MRYILISMMVLVGILCTNTVYSQILAVKTNLLYDATETVDLGLEFALSQKITFNILTSYNFWEPKISRNKRLNLILFQPEFRYWLKERFNGHFFGIHSHYSYYNVGGNNWLLNSAVAISTLLELDFKNYHRKGWLLGAGFSYGYNWMFSKRWSLETTIGFGYAYMDYEKLENPIYGELIGNKIKHYFGPTKAGVTLMFMIE